MKLLPILIALGAAKNSRNQRQKPNIIIFILDDQDVQLRSREVMHKTQKLLIDRGVLFENAFTTTPTCCPSRSSMLTGLYAHNHHVMTNNENCTGSEWIEKFEPNTYGVKLKAKNYKTAFFGKYLNEYNASYVPPGWTRWFGLRGNSRYFNYKVADYDERIHKESFLKEPKIDIFGNKKEEYFSDVIVDKAVEYFEVEKNREGEKDDPLLMVMNFPAPHGPEDAHPDYEHKFDDPGSYPEKYEDILMAHRALAYNKTDWQDKEKHWFLTAQKPLTEDDGAFTDFLQRRRLQTLFSVDDGIKRVFDAVEKAEQMDNTYFIYTSDHGYHLGQFGVVKGKALPYDFDSRIPFYMKGPDIPEGQVRKEIVLNIDLMPTLLKIAGYNKDEERELDGTSILNLAKGKQRHPWREYFLIERGKFPNNMLFSKPNKQEYIKQLCQNRKMADPKGGECVKKQTHFCSEEVSNGLTTWKISKCRRKSRNGMLLENNSCCCYECLKRQHDKIQREKCEKDPNRRRRAIYSPQSYPMSSPCPVTPQKSCECQQKQRAQNGRPRRRSKNLVTAMKSKFDESKDEYKQNREFHRGIRNQHNKREKRKGNDCKQRGMACFTVNSDSFDTHPRWELEDQCYCISASNGTFFCLRHITEEENYLYCEFITGDQEFYDMKTDPNAELNLWILTEDSLPEESFSRKRWQELKEELPGNKDKMFNCQGVECKPEVIYKRYSNVRNRRRRSKKTKKSIMKGRHAF